MRKSDEEPSGMTWPKDFDWRISTPVQPPQYFKNYEFALFFHPRLMTGRVPLPDRERFGGWKDFQ